MYMYLCVHVLASRDVKKSQELSKQAQGQQIHSVQNKAKNKVFPDKLKP